MQLLLRHFCFSDLSTRALLSRVVVACLSRLNIVQGKATSETDFLLLLVVGRTCVPCPWRDWTHPRLLQSAVITAVELLELDSLNLLARGGLVFGVDELLLVLGADNSRHRLLGFLLHPEVISFVEVQKVAV